MTFALSSIIIADAGNVFERNTQGTFNITYYDENSHYTSATIDMFVITMTWLPSLET